MLLKCKVSKLNSSGTVDVVSIACNRAFKNVSVFSSYCLSLNISVNTIVYLISNKVGLLLSQASKDQSDNILISDNAVINKVDLNNFVKSVNDSIDSLNSKVNINSSDLKRIKLAFKMSGVLI